MAYVKLFSLPENQYCATSPLIIAAGALLKNDSNGNVVAQLKFRSVDDREIIAIKVSVTAMDVSGNPLPGQTEYQYLDLQAKRNAEFGQKQAIPLPDKTARSFTVCCTEVVFGNGEKWVMSENGVWEALPKQKKLTEELNWDLLTQYHKIVTNQAKYVATQHGDLWLCACGAVNHSAEETCHKCKKSFTFYADALDRDALQNAHEQAEAERLAKEAEAREKAAAEQKALEEKQQAQRKKVIKIVAIVGPITAAVIAFLIILNSVIIPNSKYNDAVALYNNGQYEEAIAAFTAMEGYKDSAEQIISCETAIMDGKYDDAVALMDAGKTVEAYEALIALDGYKDSAAKAVSIYEEYKSIKLKNAKVGDYVIFGAYEQDNDTSNGKEEIEWLVLDVQDGKALVISKYALDCQPYNTEWEDITWETCTLRSWLNNDFINTAFSGAEQTRIPTVTVSADKNPEYDTNPGNATQDQVFLLSIDEADKYFSSDDARQCQPTAYADAQGAYVAGNGNCLWWLRSPGDYNHIAAYVGTGGGVLEDVGPPSVDRGSDAVRPALWIDLDS